MSEHGPEDGGQEDVERAAPAPSPSPAGRSAAAAARRARRIGGAAGPAAPAPHPRPTPQPGSVDLAKAPAVAAEEPIGERFDERYEDEPPARPATVVPTWLRMLPAGVLSAAVLVMAVLLVVLSHGVWWAKPSSAAARDRVLAAAKTCMVAINTYDYRKLDAYERGALACTTGALTGDLRKAIDSIVKVRAPQLKASQQIQIHEVGIQSVTSKHWTLLVFAQVNLKSVTYPTGSRTPYAAEIEMTRAHGRWLVSRETTLGSTAAPTGGGTSPSSGTPTPSPTSSGK